LLDSQKTGNIAWRDFEAMMARPVFVTYMASVGLEVNDVELFFHSIAEKADQNTVTIDQFVNGCMHMRGVASGIDMQKALFEQHLMHMESSVFQKEVAINLSHLNGMMGRVLCSTAGAATPNFSATETELGRLTETDVKVVRIEDMVTKLLANSLEPSAAQRPGGVIELESVKLCL